MAVLRERVWQLSVIAAFRVSKSKMWSSFERAPFHPSSVSGTRHFVKFNGKHLFRRLYGEGEIGSSKQAETEMMRECNRCKCKSEVHNSQDHRGELRNDTEGYYSDIKEFARRSAKMIKIDMTITWIGLLICMYAMEKKKKEKDKKGKM